MSSGLILTATRTRCELLTSEFSISKTREIARDRRAFGFVWFFFFFFQNETEREKYNDVNVTVAITLRGFESFKVLRVDLRREREKESNGKEKELVLLMLLE